MSSPTLLHFTQEGARYWQRHKTGWQPLDGPPGANTPVWILSNLAGESFIDIETPPLHGRNLHDLLARRLATQFPDTPWKTVVNISSRWWQKIPGRPTAPTRCTLFGISNSQKLEALLKDKHPAIAAVQATSLLLAEIAQTGAGMPDELLVILPDTHNLRIVFLRQRRPLLTRLVPWREQAEVLLEEVERTCRHLASSPHLQPATPVATRPAILLLGGQEAASKLLVTAGHTLLASAGAWQPKQIADKHFLFDLAIRKTHFGQLAPYQQRQHYLTLRSRQPVLALAVIIAITGGATMASKLIDYRQLQQDIARTQTTLQQLHNASTRLARSSAAQPDLALVRQAVQLHDQQLAAAPDFANHLHALASALDTAEITAFKLNRLDWRIIESPDTACAPAAQPIEATALAELRIELQIPTALSAATQSQLLQHLAHRLTQLPGAHLVIDPSRAPVRQALPADEQPTNAASSVSACLTLTASNLHATRPPP
ncbi:MAG: hypothetical protein KUL75_02515 [Sterolibacterium sp.]|nr:hypothetical protein [Sterolibacterium sp.]